MPMRGRSIPLTSSYSLTIRNDSVISYLPYYGRAYSIPYGGGDGLNFKTMLKEYNVKMDKKGNAVIEFVARNPEDRYEFRAKVFPMVRQVSMSICKTVSPLVFKENWI